MLVFQVMTEKYQQEYDVVPSIIFGDGDHIALDIPDEGVQTESGWEIKPLHKPHVSLTIWFCNDRHMWHKLKTSLISIVRSHQVQV